MWSDKLIAQLILTKKRDYYEINQGWWISVGNDANFKLNVATLTIKLTLIYNLKVTQLKTYWFRWVNLKIIFQFYPVQSLIKIKHW